MAPIFKTCRKGKACGRTCVKKKRADGKRTKCTKPRSPYVVNYTPSRPGSKPKPTKDPARPQAPPKGSHIISLSINLISGSSVTGDRCTATSRMSCGDVTQFIIPLVNDIYNKAGIFFQVKRCAKVRADEKKLKLNNSVRSVEKLFDRSRVYDTAALNVFMVPLISQGSHGYQLNCANSFIVMAESDPSTCAEENRLRFANTLAHEIGHDLGLSIHPKKHHPDPNNLMYAYSPADGGAGGSALTRLQIKTLRATAKKKYPMRPRVRGKLITVSQCGDGVLNVD